jgi:hypothetical protein
MDNEKFTAVLFAIVAVVFIGGCSYTLSNDNNNMRVCLNNEGYEWVDGNCVRDN